jgi:cyanophycinase-like exopeptidase
MVTPHQNILKEIVGEKLILDTPYGFQENADELTTRIQTYFEFNVGQKTKAIQLRSKNDKPAEIANAISAINNADWVFTGPGSPTYALNTWKESGAGEALKALLTRGTLVVSSAAALTVGTHTMPVYEMYKVGMEPFWVDGLNLLGVATGLSAAVIPHFNNAEGGTHDTRYCYIGEKRIRTLETLLPEEVFILGIDEHTGVRFDVDSQTANVFGKGAMTVRMSGKEWRVESGNSATFKEIREHAGTRLASAPDVSESVLIAKEVEELLVSGNVNSAVEALLNLDRVERDIETRAQVHALVTRLGELAASPKVDIATIVGPYIEALLTARESARKQGNWSEADAIRDKLTELKVSIKDSKDGSTWQIQ